MKRQAKGARSVEPPVTLDEFLAHLDPQIRGEVRAAAERMDALERSIDHLRDVEYTYRWHAVAAAVLFVAGAVLVLVHTEWSAMMYRTLGPMVILGMIAALPLLGAMYAFKVRDRSVVDLNKIALNRKHFLPHEAYYFPPEQKGEHGRVVHVTVRDGGPRPRSKYDGVRPGSLW